MSAITVIAPADITITAQPDDIAVTLIAHGVQGAPGLAGAPGVAGPVGPSGGPIPAGGTFGQLPVKLSDANGAAAWASRTALTVQPVLPIDWSDLTQGQLQGSNLTNLASRFATAYIAPERQFTSVLNAVWYIGVLTPVRLRAGLIVRTSCRATAASSIANAGLAIGFSPVAPAGGAAVTALDAGFSSICWRGNGAVVAYQRDGATVAGSVVISGLPGAPFAIGQRAELVLAIDDTGTGGAITLLLDGDLVGRGTVTGLAANAYVWIGPRISGSSDIVWLGTSEWRDVSADTIKRIHLDPNNAGAAIGTERNPYTSLRDAIADASYDAARRTLDIALRRGIYRGTLAFPATNWREVRIRSVQGHGAQIWASEQIAPGGWTKVAGRTNLWHRPHKWGQSLNTTASTGGLVEVTAGATQSAGRTGSVTLPFVIYSRAAPNLSFATLDATPARFCVVTVATEGVPAGSIVVHARGGADPNTLTFERSLYDACIALNFVSDNDWNTGTLDISGIETRYGYAANVMVQRARARLERVIARGASAGYGFQFNQSDVQGQTLLAEGCAADGFNLFGGGFAGPAPDIAGPFEVTLFDSVARGMPTLADWFGDGFSNHAGQRLNLHNCRAEGVAKDGLSAVDSFRLTGFEARDCADTGIKLGPPNGATVTGYARGGLVDGCNWGAGLITASNISNVARLELERVHFSGHVSRSVATSANPGLNVLITARNCTTSGAVPASGHVVSTPVGTVSVINGAGLA
ncbi:MAG TPA: hypothetical protein PL096_11930 [Micropepsaceae bacterium]|nr:hypothetical protein [Micropepsaceae bacterium]